jgi:hypothetical protein
MGLSAVCNRLGWQAFACHGNHTDISASCAVIINDKSRTIKVSNHESPKVKTSLNGRFASVEVEIEGITTWLTSIYLNANPAERGLNVNDLHSEPDLIHKISIIGGDFNCVADTNLDSRTAAGTGSTTYSNAHSVQVEAFMAHYGLTDIYRLYHGNSRYSHTGIATRIDRIYGPRHHSPWRWTCIDASISTLTNRESRSDHTPVVAVVATARD